MRHSSILAGILATALGASAPALAVTHIVQQSGFAFSPDLITINVGDTVTWQWGSLSHTVTSGTGAADPQAGSLFDAPLNSFNPSFSHTFTTAGAFDYFCRPHELMGMVGVVIVQTASGVDEVPLRAGLALSGAPNPFNPRTVISFELPETAAATLRVHDAAGRLVRVLADGVTRSAGRHETSWDGLDSGGRLLPAGVYVATIEAAGRRDSVKLTLAK